MLAYFDESGLRSLAQSLPEVDFVIGGPTGQAMKPAMVGPVRCSRRPIKVSSSRKNSTRRASGKRFETKSIGPAEVTSDLAENASLVDNLKRYYATLAKRDFTVTEAGLASAVQGDSAYRIAGSESAQMSRGRFSCVAFVAAQPRVGSPGRKASSVRSVCQQCHTTDTDTTVGS